MFLMRNAFFCMIVLVVFGFVQQVVAQDVDGREVVAQCNYKNPGGDQRNKLSITLRDRAGNERKSVYQRLWKDFHGKDMVADKMVLFTEYPPDAVGTGFMRWAFTEDAGKNADQWIYLPELRKTRRVSIRDPGDSFLGSDLTYADISGRSLDQDEHKFIKIEEKEGRQLYVVESLPKEASPLYSKRISWFTKAKDWEACVKVGVVYYDRKGQLLKQQSLSWQQVGDGAWMWRRVEVRNVQTGTSSLFEVDKAEVDVGLKDNVFTERTLKRGYKRR